MTGPSPDKPASSPGAPPRLARALSPSTVRVYAAAWAGFQAWCRARDAACLPASPHTVAAYLEACAAGLGPSSLRRLMAALAQHHRSAGQAWPAGDPLIARTLADLRARAPRPKRVATFATAELRRLLETCPVPAEGGTGLAACRDRALLLAACAAGLRRSELVALDHDDVRFTAQGMTLHLAARARAGSTAARVGVAREADASLCAVRAMQAWLHRAGIGYGPVFLRIAAAGTLEGRLTGNGVWKILRRRAALAGLGGPGLGRVSPQALRKSFGARGA